MGTPGATTQAVTMKSFVLSSLFACGLAAPTTHVNSGVPVGPLTPAFGDAVQTPKGLRSLALEGFSEDLNQDGFVDPIGQAVVAAPVAYTVPHLVAAPNVWCCSSCCREDCCCPRCLQHPQCLCHCPSCCQGCRACRGQDCPCRRPRDIHSAPRVHPRRLIRWCSRLHRAPDKDCCGRPCHPVRGRPLCSPHPLRQWHPCCCAHCCRPCR